VVVVPLALTSRKQIVVSRDDDNVMTTAMRFVGAAFIFIGSFANFTSWQGASSANASLKTEIAPLSALVLIGRYPTGPRRDMKWMQVFTSVAVVSAVWFSVLSTQDVSVQSERFNVPIESFLARYK